VTKHWSKSKCSAFVNFQLGEKSDTGNTKNKMEQKSVRSLKMQKKLLPGIV